MSRVLNEFAAASDQRLEPLSRYVKTLSGAVQYLAGDRATALTLLEEVVGDDPDFVLAVWLLSWGCSHMSRHDVAVAMGERAAALSNRHGHYLGSLGMFYGRALTPGPNTTTTILPAPRMTTDDYPP